MSQPFDTIVFDIDGVLIDTYPSFRQAILAASSWVLKERLSLTGGPLTDLAVTDTFKAHLGFNDDFDVTEALIFFFAAKSKAYGERAIPALWRLSPSLSEALEEGSERGGGKTAFQKALRDRLGLKRVNAFPRLAREVFRQAYAGSDIGKIYGRSSRESLLARGAEEVCREGLWRREKVLLKVPLSERFAYGIVTGRNRGETECALQLLGEESAKFQAVICADDGVKKPNPEALARVAEELGTKSGIYIGDTRDDCELVRRYQERWGTPSFSCAIVGNLHFNTFPHLQARDVNLILRQLYA